MKEVIKGTSKEIADLVLRLQDQQNKIDLASPADVLNETFNHLRENDHDLKQKEVK